MEIPIWEHNCPRCTYLGGASVDGAWADFYRCVAERDGRRYFSHSVRIGHDPWQEIRVPVDGLASLQVGGDMLMASLKCMAMIDCAAYGGVQQGYAVFKSAVSPTAIDTLCSPALSDAEKNAIDDAAGIAAKKHEGASVDEGLLFRIDAEILGYLQDVAQRDPALSRWSAPILIDRGVCGV